MLNWTMDKEKIDKLISGSASPCWTVELMKKKKKNDEDLTRQNRESVIDRYRGRHLLSGRLSNDPSVFAVN